MPVTPSCVSPFWDHLICGARTWECTPREVVGYTRVNARVSGVEVLREVKSDEKLNCIPVVMLTSSREAQDLRECYRLGANGYVVKPVDAKQFTQAITNIGAYWAATNEPPPL